MLRDSCNITLNTQAQNSKESVMGMLGNKELTTAYAEALEHVQHLFNRLRSKNKITESCKDCPLINEVETLKLLFKEEQFKQTEEQIGYKLT
jgi:hypothetical protein